MEIILSFDVGVGEVDGVELAHSHVGQDKRDVGVLRDELLKLVAMQVVVDNDDLTDGVGVVGEEGLEGFLEDRVPFSRAGEDHCDRLGLFGVIVSQGFRCGVNFGDFVDVLFLDDDFLHHLLEDWSVHILYYLFVNWLSIKNSKTYDYNCS